MKVHFVTPTRISLINLTTIGDSEKREDETKIGAFSSGQAYATALLLRNNVGLEVCVYGGYITEAEKYTEIVNYSTTNKVCESTNKSKEVIVLDYGRQFHGNCESALSFREGHTEHETIETAFALQLGYNWELWMALRELYSNMLDEGGYVIEQESYPEPSEGTVITLSFDEDNPFFDIWQNRHLYINEQCPLYVIDNSLSVLPNEEEYIRIYKQNILVYEDKERYSKYAYNISFGQIDERRILSDVYSIRNLIAGKIAETKNIEFLKTIISHEFENVDNDFLNGASFWCSVSDVANNLATEIYEEHGKVDSYSWLMSKIKERKDCKIGGKIIKTIEDSLWNYSTNVVIETLPQGQMVYDIPLEDSLQNRISSLYNFHLDVDVKYAKLKGSVVVADKFENCLIVDEDNFKLEEHFNIFIVEYLSLTKEGNVITNLSNMIVELIRK